MELHEFLNHTLFCLKNGIFPVLKSSVNDLFNCPLVEFIIAIVNDNEVDFDDTCIFSLSEEHV